MDKLAEIVRRKNAGESVASLAKAFKVYRGELTQLFTLLRRLGYQVRDGRTNEMQQPAPLEGQWGLAENSNVADS